MDFIAFVIAFEEVLLLVYMSLSLWAVVVVVYFETKNRGKILNTQGKCREFGLDRSVAILYEVCLYCPVLSVYFRKKSSYFIK